MDAYVKRYFWLLGAVVVVVCTIFLAKGFNHYVEAKYLADDSEAVRAAPAQRPQAKRESRSKSGVPLAERNMFCYECEPPQAEETEDEPAVAGDTVPLTSLPLRVVATNVASRREFSFATVENTQSQQQGAYWIDDVIPAAGKVVEVRGKYVDFENAQSRRVERISLLQEEPARARPTPQPARPRARAGPQDELMAAVDEGVNKLDDNSYEIDRSLVDKVLSNPAAVARGARIVPSIKNGKPNGFKLYAIRPNSVYAKIGLMNGDTIHAVNGFELTTADKALEVYTKVREANSLTVQATRRGKPVTLSYSIK
jgi:general secretion pathway protein C